MAPADFVQEGSAMEAPADEDGSSELTHSSDEELNWIAWFVSLKGNEYFCEIEEDYIQDDFNLTGLSAMVPFYDYALDMMLDVEIPSDHLTEDQLDVVETAAEALYGLIHARYILTVKGMARMNEKFAGLDFGRCPRVRCQGQAVLPMGMSDVPRNYSVTLFCPRCHDLFNPKNAKQSSLDGAYFGTTFAHLFLLTNPDNIPLRPQQAYIPRIYGFRIHKDSVYWKNGLIDNKSPNSNSKGSPSASEKSNSVKSPSNSNGNGANA